ncbi:MAG: hypothetical protein ACJ8BW_21860 [Ktedonobacteraceae bacterium]
MRRRGRLKRGRGGSSRRFFLPVCQLSTSSPRQPAPPGGSRGNWRARSRGEPEAMNEWTR